METLTESRTATWRRQRRIRRSLRRMARLAPPRERARPRRWASLALWFAWLVGVGVALVAVPVLPKEPLGQPPPAPTGGGSYAFLHSTAGGAPVAYDPCQPIRYVVEDELGVAPPGAADLVEAAVVEVSQATGLVFERVEPGEGQLWSGFGTEIGAAKREPARIVWTHEGEHEALAGQVLGEAGSAAVMEMGGDAQLAAGWVHLDGPGLTELLEGRPDGAALVQAAVMHELAHMVGLGHVPDPGEVMYPVAVGQTSWGPGDREGLALVGSGQCFARRPLVDAGRVVEVVEALLGR